MVSRTPKSVRPDQDVEVVQDSSKVALPGRQPLDRFISSIAFELPDLLVDSAWREHAPFVFWLVETLRPATFVELGTYSGYSYFAACQAVQRLDLSTQCYAVDTWQGDEHAGFYDEDVFEVVERHNSTHYADFSRLLRATFDDVLDRFDAKSIDLLHIDGRHRYEDVKHDFESWLPKLSERAVVILHDTNVRGNGFGVHRYWPELAERYPHFEFLHGHGLGVISVGKVDPGLKYLFDASSDTAALAEIRKVYSSAGRRIAHEIEALTAKTSEPAVEIAELKQELARARDDSAESSRRSDELSRISRERGLDLARAEQALKLANADGIGEPQDPKTPLGEITEDEAAELSESGLFDAGWYASTYPDVADDGTDPLEHYLRFGVPEGRKPNPVFDSKWYLSQNPDIAETGMNPALHYLRYGAVDGRDPSPAFDSKWYLSQNPDVAAAGMNPLVHYLRYGMNEGRSPIPPGGAVIASHELPAITRPGHEVLRLRVLIVANLGLPQCSMYRVWQKKTQLASLGVDCTVVEWTKGRDIRAALQTHTLAIFYRVPGDASQLEHIAEAHRLKIPVLWETDDLIFDAEIYNANQNLETLDPALRESVVSGVPLFLKALVAAGQGIASTEKIAAAMERHGCPAFVIENGVDDATIERAGGLREQRQTSQDGPVQVFYGSGSKAHDADFACAAGGLRRAMEAFPNMRLRIVGELNLGPQLEEFGDRVDRLPFCDYQIYLSEIAAADINIAPLETCVFNDAKSNIKFLEAALLGLPTIASPRETFANVIVSGRNGYLAETEDDWFNALSALAEDGALRRKVGRAALDDALARYRLEPIARQQVEPMLAALCAADREVMAS